jgi:DNA-binding NtrC family response regulator
MKRFMAYAWPGNVRELRNTIESMAVLASGDVLDEALAEEAEFGLESQAQRQSGSVEIPLNATLAQAEQALIASRMRQLRSKAEVAKSLGIGLRTLYSKLREASSSQPSADSARRAAVFADRGDKPA